MKPSAIPSRYLFVFLKNRIFSLADDANVSALSLDILGILLLVATLAPAVKPSLSRALVDSVETIDSCDAELCRKVKYDSLYSVGAGLSQGEISFPV